MTADPTEVATALEALERRWVSITDALEEPRSLMDVIEYGLGDQRRAEVYLNRLLCYLLDPEGPHGMGADFLDAFLRGLPADCQFDEDTYDLSAVRVNQQVPIRDAPDEGEESLGYADLVLEVPNEWFLLVELKFAAAETSTEFYCAASEIDGRPVGEYESGRYYLYLHRHDRPTASGDCFANWTWQAFVGEVLDPFVAQRTARYPQRTASQLHDLRYDLQNVSAMNSHDDTDQEKVALYLDHVDAIEDVRSTFDDAWESYATRWDELLVASLDGADIGAHQMADERFSEIGVPRGEEEPERWIILADGGDWQHLFKYGWYKHEDDLRNLAERADDRNDLRIGFYHRMGANRDAAVRDHTLKFNFRCMGSNPTGFIDAYERNFVSRTREVEALLSETNGELTGQKRTLIAGTYEIDVDAHDNFFEAYTAALHDAFVDFVVENPELIRVLGELFEESIAEYH